MSQLDQTSDEILAAVADLEAVFDPEALATAIEERDTAKEALAEAQANDETDAATIADLQARVEETSTDVTENIEKLRGARDQLRALTGGGRRSAPSRPTPTHRVRTTPCRVTSRVVRTTPCRVTCLGSGARRRCLPDPSALGALILRSVPLTRVVAPGDTEVGHFGDFDADTSGGSST